MSHGEAKAHSNVKGAQGKNGSTPIQTANRLSVALAGDVTLTLAV